MADQSTSNPPSSMSDLDLRLKEMDVEEKRSKLDAMKSEWGRTVPWWSHWNNPVALAVLAALIGYLGTLLTWSLARWDEAERHERTLNMEKEKSQGTLILEAMKAGVGQDQQVAANLVVLADAGVLTFEPAALKKLRERAGKLGAALPSPVPPSRPEIDKKAYKKIRADVAYAVSVLNPLFGLQFNPPDVKPSEFEHNAYADISSRTVHAPAAVQYIPDIAYREVSHLYLPLWDFDGESAALGTSVADVLAAVVKQRQLGQTAQTADWVLYPRAVAWLKEEELARSTDTTPLRSLKTPGKAYDEDRQVDHMAKYVMTRDPHSNSGIPSKAFYEAAMKLGTDKAAAIWVKAITAVPGPRPTFAEFARETVQQAETLQGEDARKFVLAAWETVGVVPAK